MIKRFSFYILLTLVATLMRVDVHPEAYVLNGTKWPAFPIVFRVNGANADMTSNEAKAEVDLAAAVWEDDATSAVDFTDAGTTTLAAQNYYDGVNTVWFSSGTNGSLGAMTTRYSSGTTMVAFDMVVYDGAFEFLKNDAECTGSKLFLLDTLTHEFGHALGLTHSTDATATMRSSMAYCTSTMRDLAADDIAGILFLYPASVSASPTAPTALKAAVKSDTEITLSWLDNSSNESGFQIYRSTDNVSYSLVTTVAPNVAAYTNTGLTASTLYYYKVRATNASGQSAYTNVASATTSAVTTQAILLDAATDQNRKFYVVTLTWTGTTNAVDIYRNGAKIAAVSAGTTAYTQNIRKSGVTSGTSYVYLVCLSGSSVCSNTTSVSF